MDFKNLLMVFSKVSFFVLTKINELLYNNSIKYYKFITNYFKELVMSNISKDKKIEVKTIANQFKDHKINIHLHFWQNGRTDKHSHEFFEVFLITKGKCQHIHNDMASILSENTLCLVKPGEIHQFLPVNGIEAVHCNVRVTPSLFQTLCAIVNPTLYDLLLNQTELVKCKLNNQEMEYTLHHISTAHFTFDHVSGEEYSSIATVLMTTFLLYFHLSLKSKQLYPKWFSKFLNTLNSVDSFSKPLSQLYKESGYSQTALNAYFKQYMGKTLVAYMIERRINYACNLLKTTDYSILQISLMASFNNLSNFNATFKKIIGETPTQYRQHNSLLIL